MYIANPMLSLEENFLVIMNPDLQQECAANPARCYFGDAPSLSEMKIACSADFTASWIMLQINSVAESVCGKDNIPVDVIKCASYDILNNYSWLSASEIMLFCSRVRVGMYGKLAYGNLTIDDITSKLIMFIKNRGIEMASIEREFERERKEEEYEKMRKNAVKKEDAYRIVNAAADGDVEARKILHDDPEAWKNRIYEIEWITEDESLKSRISSYFGISKNPYTNELTAMFVNDRYGKFIEGHNKGYYKIKQ